MRHRAKQVQQTQGCGSGAARRPALLLCTRTTKHQAGVGSWATATSPPAFSTHNSAPLDGPQARAHAPHRLCWTGGIGPGSAPLRHLQTHGFTGDMQQAGAGISAMLGPCPHTHTHTTTSSLQKHLSATQSPGDTPATDGEGKKVCKPDLLLEGVHGG